MVIVKNFSAMLGWAAVSAAATLSVSSGAAAAVYENNVVLVAKSDKYAQVAPEPKYFSVSAPGRYRVAIADVGFPNPLTSVALAITKGTETVLRVANFGTHEFDATPGTFAVHVLGKTGGAGSVGVSVAPISGGTSLLEFQAGIVSNPSPGAAGRSTLARQIVVTSAGTYQVTLTDRRFPAPLTSFDLLIVSASGVPVARVCQPSIPGVCGSTPTNFAAQVGSYDVFVNAAAASPLLAGLYSIKIADTANATLYGATHPVGVLESHAFIEFPASGPYALTLNDLQFPTSLAKVSAVIAQGSELLTTVDGAVTQSFNASAGAATLYTIAEPTAQGVGTLGVHVPNGTQTLYSDAKAVVGTTGNGARAYAFLGTFPSAGLYRIQARDFAFPASIPTLQLLVTQDGAPLGAVPAGGSLTVPAKAGPFMIVAVANMQSSTATGLFGVVVDAQPSGTELLSVAQGVGDLFHSRSVTVTSTGNVNVSLVDIGFPSLFEDLALIVTRGNTLVGQIFGGGAFAFPATPGSYSLNFVARNSAAENYGLYGLKLEDSPAAPSLTFTATSGSVPPQGSATVSWSTIGATACVASGGWSGSRATSGTNVAVGPIAADTTLTLTCTGPGGEKSADAKIVVVAPPAETGGGSTSVMQLAGLLMLLLARALLAMRSKK